MYYWSGLPWMRKSNICGEPKAAYLDPGTAFATNAEGSILNRGVGMPADSGFSTRIFLVEVF